MEDLTKPKNPFRTVTIIEAITLITSVALFSTYLLNNVAIYSSMQSLYLYMFFAVMLTYVLTQLSSFIFFRINNIKSYSLYPFAMHSASKIYKKKTGKELVGNNYKELVNKLDEAKMINNSYQEK